MCAIVGVSGDWNEETLLNLLKWSRIRGLHAFGYAFIENNQLVYHKFLNYKEFCDSIIENKPNKFIAHFRYSTSGDWKIPKNNQPIIFNQTALVFNGVIEMSTKEEMESKWECTLNTENDGEIALLQYSIGRIDELIDNKTRSFAGLFLNENNEIVAIRNRRRPMYVGEQDNCYYLASTHDILNRSNIKNITEIRPHEQHKY